MKRKLPAAVFFAAVTVLGFAASADAVDGTIDINQAKVVANGGFQFVISSPGSYRLTGNLSVPAGANGIAVAANFVTIDLNGFSITGPGSGNGSGIASGLFGGITVENGSVTGFHDGVVLGDDSTVKSVHADLNAHNGITVGNNSRVEACTANSNSNRGITTGNNSVVEGSTANSNTSDSGITAGDFGVVEGSTASSNGFFGIVCHSGCTISGNSTANNHTTGIVADNSSLILHNTSTSNNDGGISATGATTGYGENVLNGNLTNVVGGTSMGNNVCSGVIC